MGFFNNSITPSVTPTHNPLLLPGEQIEKSFKLMFDELLLTDRRVIFSDGKAIGSKRKIVSVAYSKITAVEIEKGGTFSFGQEITIVSGSKEWEVKSHDPKVSSLIYNAIVEKIC